MFVTRKHLTRRAVLRGLGATLGLPLLAITQPFVGVSTGLVALVLLVFLLASLSVVVWIFRTGYRLKA